MFLGADAGLGVSENCGRRREVDYDVNSRQRFWRKPARAFIIGGGKNAHVMPARPSHLRYQRSRFSASEN
jgi:hypothetical protein